ncbi:hypothetical protein [uncultured Polaribacter sp.]|uniref:hypothetical protein n=1 Tax=uncultured Polaribacter sp. TaxID=174711 RepID=UPI002622C343|nr:hypothetical protein [uncultured Polaribacter sp.]
MDIKNDSLIVSISKSKLIIKNTFNNKPTKLGHVLNSLPSGIIDKSITGLGGTTLELDCKRNSIIVEPLKFTAESKAKKPSFINEYQVFFFGATKKKKQEIKGFSTKNFEISSNTNDMFDKYLDKCKKHKQPIKITCVSDQLAILRNYLKETKKKDFKGFHLLLDEIDSMQEQSSFRNVMHDCMKIYKEHPKEKRSLLSATISKFHDPDLKNEPFIKIKYENQVKTHLDLLVTNNVVTRTIKTISELINGNDDKKILVAYNHLKGIEDIIKELESASVSKNDIAILYSSSKKKPINGYERSEIIDTSLPKKINFITAAYFNGFDLQDDAHVIIAVDAKVRSLAISSKTVYQICGRLRKGAASIKVIGRFKSIPYTTYGFSDLKKAFPILERFICVSQEAKNSEISYLQDFGQVLSKWILNKNDKYESIIAESDTGLEISYIKIDNVLVKKETYISLESFQKYRNALNTNFIIDKIENYKDEPEKEEAETTYQILELVKELSSNRIIKEIKDNTSYSGKIAKQTIRTYELAKGCNILIEKKVLVKIRKILTMNNWEKELKYLNYHVEFHNFITADNNLTYNNQLSIYFKSPKKLTIAEFNKKIKNIVRHLKEVTKKENKSIVKAVKNVSGSSNFTKSLLKVSDTKDKNIRYRKVNSFNLFGIIDLKKSSILKFRK